ncbi:MAG: hypothetical protein R2747_14025 [Pyrinomonadaceae bacterium]
MKTYFLILSIALFFQTACAQKQVETESNKSAINSTQQGDAELRAKVKTQAEEMHKAFLSGDYEKLFELTYPKVRERIGKEKFISEVKNGMKSMEAEGFKLVIMNPKI